MARSKFIWLVIYETGETQFIKAQTILFRISRG